MFLNALSKNVVAFTCCITKAVNAIINANGLVPYCLANFTYGLDAATKAFEAVEPKCEPFTILSYPVMIQTAVEVGYINDTSNIRNSR